MKNRPTPGSRYRSRDSYDERTIPPGMRASQPDTTPSARQRALRFLPVALGAVAGVLLVIVGVAFFSHRTTSPPLVPVDRNARQLCADLTTQQYDDLYNMLSTAEQGVGTRDQFVASQRQLDVQLGTVSGCAYTLVSQDAANARISLRLTRGSSPTTAATVRLVMQGSDWRIADYDSSLVAMPGAKAQFSRVWSMSNGG